MNRLNCRHTFIGNGINGQKYPIENIVIRIEKPNMYLAQHIPNHK